jgi:predicted MFS family arabinose efflux permease
MAVVGISIGLSFVLALIAAPALDAAIGVPGIFGVMLAMALLGVALLHFAVPREPPRHGGPEGRKLSGLLELVRRSQLRPLYFGMFALHAIMTATFLSVPQVLLDDLGLPSAEHWQVYLGVFVVSIAGTVPLVLVTERSGPGAGGALLVLSVALAGLSQAILGLDHAHLWVVLGALTLFFAAFNYLEARLPALLTQAAPTADRGAALGVFATAQFLGAFFGGTVGGLLLRQFGISGVFWGCAGMALAWVLFAGRSGEPAPEASVSG